MRDMAAEKISTEAPENCGLEAAREHGFNRLEAADFVLIVAQKTARRKKEQPEIMSWKITGKTRVASQLHTQRVIIQQFAREQHPSGVWSPAGRILRVVSLPSTALSQDRAARRLDLGAQTAQQAAQTPPLASVFRPLR